MKMYSHACKLIFILLLNASCGQQSSNNAQTSSQPQDHSNQLGASPNGDKLPVQVALGCNGSKFHSFDSDLISDPNGTYMQLWAVQSISSSEICKTSRPLTFDASIRRKVSANHKTLELQVGDADIPFSDRIYTSICTSEVPMQILLGAVYSCAGHYEGTTFEVAIKVLQ